MRSLFVLMCCAFATACSQPWDPFSVDAPDPVPEPEAAAVPAEAAPEIETAPDPQRAALPASGNLGTTIATLGDPTQPGLWAETPLVDRVRSGRLTDSATGSSAAVELRPAPGAVGAGSRVSLDTLRALGAPLTALVELTVYAD